MTRAAAKRKASMAMATDEERVSKKRVVLGELLNVPNLNQKRVTQKPQKAVRVLTKQIKTVPVVVVPEDAAAVAAGDIDARSDDPQMCGPYVTDIYEYLREMEVIIIF